MASNSTMVDTSDVPVGTLTNPLAVTQGTGITDAVNLTQVNSKAVATGNGTAATSIRVALPTDGTGVVGLNAGSNLIGSVTLSSDYPSGATALTGASGNKANAEAVATLAKASGKTNYLGGFEVTGSGATAGLPVTVTVAGLLGGSLTYTYSAVAGALLPNPPLVVMYDPPIPASGTDVDITVTCPALGAGNTNNTVTAHGYQI